MGREYDQETLGRVQQEELKILKDFIGLCERHGLTYFALAGTGIGALRHKGFIPWDDDIDVGLPRRDYEQFIRYAQEEFADRYNVVCAETNENFPLMTMRWTKKGTKFREESLQHIDCDLGIFLDIYAFDNLHDDDALMKKQAQTAWLWSKLLILRSIPHPVLGFTGAKAKLVQFVCAAVHYAMALFHVSKKWLYRKCKQASCRYNDIPTKRIAYLCDTSPYSNMVSLENLDPLLELDFEDVKLKFPNNLHEMLTAVYGDYMQLPPVEKRKNHFPFELDFGKAQ